MGEMVRKSNLQFLKFTARFFASILSLLGVLSGCDSGLTAPYGVEGTSLNGKVVSASDHTVIPGIQMSVTNAEGTEVFDDMLTSEDGVYGFSFLNDEVELPHAFLLTASDIDGDENGSFASKDTLLYTNVPGSVYYEIDFSLEEEEE